MGEGERLIGERGRETQETGRVFENLAGRENKQQLGKGKGGLKFLKSLETEIIFSVSN